MPYQAFKFFNRNTQGRDFVVGDIHGYFSVLEQLLTKIKFNPEQDRLFSVGDLIDRGPESVRAWRFLNAPWFHAIRGNHEQMLLDSASNQDLYNNWTMYNGGDWWENTSAFDKTNLRNTIKQLPLACEIDSNIGRIGLVHADIPSTCNWQRFVGGLYEDSEMAEYALWSRHRFKQLQMMGRLLPILGIDLVVFGHTPVQDAQLHGNSYYLDTGACYPEENGFGHLSILELNADLKVFRLSTRHKGQTDYRLNTGSLATSG